MHVYIFDNIGDHPGAAHDGEINTYFAGTTLYIDF
jgi:hypothetical protein